MLSEMAVFTTYRIEISGWDVDEKFFVEKTRLDWSEEHGKRVYLRHPLRDRAVVFVRLLATPHGGNNHPIAYQAEKLGNPNADGLWEARLVQVQPRPAGRATRDSTPAETETESQHKT